MAEVIWNPKKEEREIMFLYNIFADEVGWRGRRNRDISMPAIDVAAKKLDAFISGVLGDRVERDILIGTLRDMNIRTRGAHSGEPFEIKILMKEIFDHCNLNFNAFDWISPENQRLCNYIWACLRISHHSRGRLTYEQSLTITDEPDAITDDADKEERGRRLANDLLGIKKSIYDQLGLPTSVGGSHAKRDCIIRFFDLWDASREKKEDQMGKFAHAWDKVKNKSKMADWLNKNENMAGWAWNYTLKRLLNFYTPEWVDLSNSKNDEKEKNALITLYDMLSVKDQALLMGSLSKSGAVQKHRINSNNRKAMNISLSDEHKNMLKQIVKDSNRKIYQVVEDIIEQEYRRRYPEQ